MECEYLMLDVGFQIFVRLIFMHFKTSGRSFQTLSLLFYMILRRKTN